LRLHIWVGKVFITRVFTKERKSGAVQHHSFETNLELMWSDMVIRNHKMCLDAITTSSL